MTPNSYDFLGAWIKARREHLRLTQKELASATGYSVVAIKKIESDERKLPPNMADRVANALKLYGKNRDYFVDVVNGRSSSVCLPSPQVDSTHLSPFQAPPDLPHWVGRRDEMALLQRELTQQKRLAVCGVRGMGGIGKTSLAVHIAYALRDQFPDGVLWARLDTSDTMSILGAFAQAYGHDVKSMNDLQSRVAAVRGILASKRALIVLDNAQHSEQVRPLLPPSGQCAVLVTSREELAIFDEWQLIHLTAFKAELQESRQLMVNILGLMYVNRFNSELEQIADLLGHLPLAIMIVAGRLNSTYYPISASHLLAQLRQLDARLDPLVREDRSVRASFDLSYDILRPQVQALFDALGVFGGDDFDLPAIADVVATDVATAKSALQSLKDLSLVQDSHSGRFRLHPLLREYAREHLEKKSQVLTQLTQAHQLNPYQRMVMHYVQRARDNQYQRAQLKLETGNFMAALQTAHERQFEALLPVALNAFFISLRDRGLMNQLEDYATIGLSAAQRADDIRGQALVLMCQSEIAHWHTQPQLPYLQQALLLAEQCKDMYLVAQCWRHISRWYLRAGGKVAQAKAACEQGYAIVRQYQLEELYSEYDTVHALLSFYEGDMPRSHAYNLSAYETVIKQQRWGEQYANTLENLASDFIFMKMVDQANDFLKRGIEFSLQHQFNERLLVLYSLGANLEVDLRHYEAAKKYVAEGLALANRLFHMPHVSSFTINLGNITRLQGNYAQAKSYLDQARTLVEKHGYVEHKVGVLLRLAYLQKDLGDLTQARQLALEAAHVFDTLPPSEMQEITDFLMQLPVGN